MDQKIGDLLEYQHLLKITEYKEGWGKSSENDIGRLAQGMPGRVEGTNTVFFIAKNEIPRERAKDVTYGKFVVDHC